MAESPRISWIVGFSTKPALPLQFTKLKITEWSLLEVADVACVLKLRFNKKTRSNAVIEELSRIEGAGWIERRPASDPNTRFRRVRIAGGEVLELEPLFDKIETEEESEDEMTPAETLSAILCCVHDIQDRVRNIECQLKKRKIEVVRSDENVQKEVPNSTLNKTPPNNRPPIRLSFLREASVSELYFHGVWVPEYDRDTAFEGTPPRECRFRSELEEDGDYYIGYDIDDVNYQGQIPLLKNKTASLALKGFQHFVDHRPARPAVSLQSLRKESVDVLYCLGVFFPGYDTDDLYTGIEVHRERRLRTEVCDRFCLGREWHPMGYSKEFVPGYDIDDVQGKARVEELRTIMHHYRLTLEEERAAW